MRNVWWAGLCGAFMVLAVGAMVIAFGPAVKDRDASFTKRPTNERNVRPHALCSLRATGPTRLFWCLDGHAWTLTVKTGVWADLGPLRFTAMGVPAA